MIFIVRKKDYGPILVVFEQFLDFLKRKKNVLEFKVRQIIIYHIQCEFSQNILSLR